MTVVNVPIVTLDSRPFDSRVYLDKNTKAVKPLPFGKKELVQFGEGSKTVNLICSNKIKESEELLIESDITRLYKIQYRNKRVVIRYNTCSPRHLMLASADLLLFIEMDERSKFRTKCKSEILDGKICESKDLYKQYCVENTVEALVKQYSTEVVESMNMMMSKTYYSEREAGVNYVFYNNLLQDNILDKTIASLLIKIIRIGKYLRNELYLFNRGKCENEQNAYECMLYKISSSHAVKFLNAIPVYQGQQCTALNLYTQYYDDELDVSTNILCLINEINNQYKRLFE